jgi:predicted RNA-binding protein associated with RNAse of E/G family
VPEGEGAGATITYEFVRPPDRRYRFSGDLLHIDHQVIVLSSHLQPSKPISYGGDEVLASGYSAVWFLYNGQPWDVARVYAPDGRFTGYYADVLEPVRWAEADPTTLQPIVDLFLDVWIAPDGSYAVLDEDEFEEAVTEGSVTESQASAARSALRDLRDAVSRGDFPPPRVRDFRVVESGADA